MRTAQVSTETDAIPASTSTSPVLRGVDTDAGVAQLPEVGGLNHASGPGNRSAHLLAIPAQLEWHEPGNAAGSRGNILFHTATLTVMLVSGVLLLGTCCSPGRPAVIRYNGSWPTMIDSLLHPVATRCSAAFVQFIAF